MLYTTLPNGKLIQYNNILYAGLNSSPIQLSTNNQITHLQQQINNLSMGGNFIFATYNGSKSGVITYNLNEDNRDSPAIITPLIANINKYKVLYCSLFVNSVSITPHTDNKTYQLTCRHYVGGLSLESFYLADINNNTQDTSNTNSGYIIFNHGGLSNYVDIDGIHNTNITYPLNFSSYVHYGDYDSSYRTGTVDFTITYNVSMFLEIT